MFGLVGDPFVPQGVAAENARAFHYARLRADLEFDRARRRAYLGKLARLIGVRHRGAVAPAVAAGTHTVPLSAIVGVRDSRGRFRLGVPAVPRRLRREWVRIYLTTSDPEPTLAVEGGPGGLYLSAVGGALLSLEVARARGRALVSVRLVDATERQACRAICEEATGTRDSRKKQTAA